jgi:ubiquinone/menaquinone biosynthesis C-methylase UbiE
VGRLSQALAPHFREVVGVDISSSMLEKAREYNRHGDRVRYEHNTLEDLALFPDASFDFVYSNITLQHVPPNSCRRYVREFFRVLKPEGLTVFQMRGGPPVRPGSLGEKIYLFRRRSLRRLWKRVRGRPPYEMHYIARELMEEHIRDSGGALLDVVHLGGKPRYPSFRYCAERAS